MLKPGKALGSFEVWAQWCRDPLLMLGARDPVDRIEEIKAADPRRRALIPSLTLGMPLTAIPSSNQPILTRQSWSH